ncbi:MAG: biotin--[acetyl-CoA-carboxylase] ligase [Chloroflexi bacterium]|nr:biotin--[acetyl-CoA-carboxylase] ligase [Chloroflexota bacterium]
MDNISIEDSIRRDLATTFMGRHIVHYETLPSTMDVARKIAAEGAPEGTLVLAEEQTVARGRRGRVWVSPKGSLALSLILRPSLEELPRLVMVASLAVSRSIQQATGLKADIKWPNDVLIRGKKVCGILIENALRGQVVDWAVVGIGINVSLDIALYPDISAIATSLSSEAGREVPRLDVLRLLLVQMERLYLASRRGEPVYDEWQNRLITLGKRIRVRFGEAIEEGLAESVDKDGALLLRRSDGRLTTVTAGEVTLLK